jgi:hypothetical protein
MVVGMGCADYRLVGSEHVRRRERCHTDHRTKHLYFWAGIGASALVAARHKAVDLFVCVYG